MIEHVARAASRAILVAFLIAMPSMLLPGTAGDASALIVLVAILAGAMIFFEYIAEYPSVIEFRYAAPFNRLRFTTVLIVVFILAMILRAGAYPSQISLVLIAFARILGNLLDFPFSPIRLALLTLAPDTPANVVDTLRMVAAMAYAISGMAVLFFFIAVHLGNWPRGNGAFNVWVNLPMFDPTQGDVLTRLTRDARLNVMLGFILPFLIPAVVKGIWGWMEPKILAEPHALIWSVTIWACLPSLMMLRGIALGRVADMIGEKRRRAYAESKARVA
ncbi:hypothetical protein IT775_02545 [Thalassobius aquimarinus]|uniref:Uncharacterized protein n=2 Tax=Thalassovita aquimarina TaxID=2785917 RepID=A0ABS5HM62_9RHOB|nr:hypothetical protein [Thalassovita aquimarina]